MLSSFKSPKRLCWMCHIHMFSNTSATYVSVSRILHPLPYIINDGIFFLHLLWIPGLICWCKSGYDATTVLFFLSFANRSLSWKSAAIHNLRTCLLLCRTAWPGCAETSSFERNDPGGERGTKNCSCTLGLALRVPQWPRRRCYDV